jgi:hypothetical protein
MKKILFVLPFLPACIDVYLNPVKDDDTGETGIVVINPNAPKIESLTLSPDPVFTDQTLTATATVLDPDNEGSTTTYEWAWFVNDVDVEQNMETLSGLDSFNKGDTVEVQVTPTNEEGTGEMVAATVLVSNTTPTTPIIGLNPATVHQNGEDLQCVLEKASTDADEDELTYMIKWDVDGVVYTDAYKTIIAGDTVPVKDLIEGQSWTCNMLARDDEESSPNASAWTIILAPEVTFSECTDTLTSVSNPATHGTASGGGTYGIGAWFADSDAAADSRVWTMMDYDNDTITEFPSLSDLQNGSNASTILTDEDWMGTGHVAINGLIYTVKEGTDTLLVIDPSDRSIVISKSLPNADISGPGNYSYGGKSYIDLSADGGKLFAIYTTTQAGGKFVVSELNPINLNVLNTWTHPNAAKADYATAFIACEVLYAIDDTSDGSCFWCTEQSIDLSWNWSTGDMSNPTIPWTNPGTSGYIGGVSYNPVDGLLYVVRGGTLATITPSFQ